MKACLIVLGLLVSICLCQDVTYYVDVGGNDGDCSDGSPCRTLQEAFTQLTTNPQFDQIDTVLVNIKEGTYTGTSNIGLVFPSVPSLTLQANGTVLFDNAGTDAQFVFTPLSTTTFIGISVNGRSNDAYSLFNADGSPDFSFRLEDLTITDAKRAVYIGNPDLVMTGVSTVDCVLALYQGTMDVGDITISSCSFDSNIQLQNSDDGSHSFTLTYSNFTNGGFMGLATPGAPDPLAFISGQIDYCQFFFTETPDVAILTFPNSNSYWGVDQCLFSTPLGSSSTGIWGHANLVLMNLVFEGDYDYFIHANIADSSTVQYNLQVSDCVFPDTGSLVIDDYTSVTFSQCEFAGLSTLNFAISQLSLLNSNFTDTVLALSFTNVVGTTVTPSASISGCTFIGSQLVITGAGTDVALSNTDFSGPDTSGSLFFFNGPSDVTVSSCTFNDGVSTPLTQLSGGGIYGEGTGFNFQATSCEFMNNQADSYGGGVALSGADSVSFTDCNFIGNQASYGGGLSVDIFNTLVVSSTLFQSNYATISGGAMELNYNEQVYVTNGTIPGTATFNGVTFTDNDSVGSDNINCCYEEEGDEGNCAVNLQPTTFANDLADSTCVYNPVIVGQTSMTGGDDAGSTGITGWWTFVIVATVLGVLGLIIAGVIGVVVLLYQKQNKEYETL